MKIKENRMSENLFKKIKGEAVRFFTSEDSNNQTRLVIEKGNGKGVRMKLCYGILINTDKSCGRGMIIISSEPKKIPSYVIARIHGNSVIPIADEKFLSVMNKEDQDLRFACIDAIEVLSDGTVVAHV